MRGTMASSHFEAKSLSGTIFRTVLVFTLTTLVILSIALTCIYYRSYESDAEKMLTSAANDVAATLNATADDDTVDVLKAQVSGVMRYTLLSDDGTVLYDSAADPGAMPNHADRPEFRSAERDGQAVASRYSETIGTDTVYAAVQLDDGNVVRLSTVRQSLLAFLGSMLLPVLVALVIAGVLVFVLSKAMTERIMSPIDALDLSKPLENKIYEEMEPLLVRIDEQQAMLKKQNAELAEAESMRRDFSSNVSHEMKTPLQVISGYAELMKNDMVLPEDRQKFAGLIYDEAQSMRALINDVLTLSKLDESAFGVERVRIDLRAVAERMSRRLSGFAEKREVAVNVTGKPAGIFGSETLAEEMLYNLIENGIRYNHPGGEVNVVVGERSQDGKNFTTVRVSDTGPGIPADMRDKVFERFFRVDKSRSKETGGTGLGLAIVKHAVLYHKGTIRVEGADGKGTTFVMEFPAA